MQLRDAERPVGRRRSSLHNVQHLQCRHSLSVGRKFVDGPVAICGRNRLDPFRRKLGQIIRRHRAAQALRRTQNRARNLTFIKGIRSVLRHQPQGFCEIVILKYLSHCGRLAIGQVNSPALCVVRDPTGCIIPIRRDDFRDRIAIVSIENRRLEKLLPRQPSKAPVQRLPARHRSRHRD